jgi:hypothetical protein
MGLFTKKPKMPAFVPDAGGWQSFDTFITEEWATIAAAAWRQYLSKGRGMVTIDFKTNDIKYLPATASQMADAQDGMTRDIRTMCQRYDPEREFVLLIKGARDVKAAREGKLEPFYSILRPPAGQPTPREAHNAYQANSLYDAALTVLKQRRELSGDY